MRNLVAVLAVLAIPAMAHAQEFKTGNDIISAIKACEPDGRCTSDQFTEWAFAMGYVIGVHDATKTVTQCSPVGITQGQVLAVFMKKAEEVPEYWNQSADRLINAALSLVWPCQAPERPMSGPGDPQLIY